MAVIVEQGYAVAGRGPLEDPFRGRFRRARLERVGARGISLGGGAVWNAAVAGVPFRAIVPVITWTNLATALAPQGLSKSGLVQLLASLVPESRWDTDLLAAKSSLVTSTNMASVNTLTGSRSSISKLSSLSTPTL